jgi:hypothetical protein
MDPQGTPEFQQALARAKTKIAEGIKTGRVKIEYDGDQELQPKQEQGNLKP